MKNFLVIAIFCSFLPGWYSCTKDTAVATVAGPCDTTGITYNKHISRIVSTYCTQIGGCHNPATTLGTNANDLTTYIGVKADDTDTTGATAIVCWLKYGCGTDQMPKGLRALPRAYIDTFLMWRQNNYCPGN